MNCALIIWKSRGRYLNMYNLTVPGNETKINIWISVHALVADTYAFLQFCKGSVNRSSRTKFKEQREISDCKRTACSFFSLLMESSRRQITRVMRIALDTSKEGWRQL